MNSAEMMQTVIEHGVKIDGLEAARDDHKATMATICAKIDRQTWLLIGLLASVAGAAILLLINIVLKAVKLQ